MKATKELIESMGGRPVTSRTLDVGDKLLTHEAKAANLPQTALNRRGRKIRLWV